MSGLRCRQITESDVENVLSLLIAGFPERDEGYWKRGLALMGTRQLPAGAPRFGYVLDLGGRAVGVLLLIYSEMRVGPRLATRCNISSWYVDPAFRSYAPLLVAQATKHAKVTFLNISPADQTRSIIETQGFARYSGGRFVAVPLLSRAGAAGVEVGTADRSRLDAWERALLADHEAYGCWVICCDVAGALIPFVFRDRFVKGILPVAQLIYTRDLADLVRVAKPLGRYMALRGRPFIMVDAPEPIDGLRGRHIPDRLPRYFKGPDQPRVNDLCHTEFVVFGP